MISMRPLRVSFVSLASLAFFALGSTGCSVTPDAPGPTCATDDTVACNDGTGYSCTGSDEPEDSNSSLICSSGTDGNAGSTLYCCLHAVSGTTCGPDSTVAGCAPGSFRVLVRRRDRAAERLVPVAQLQRADGGERRLGSVLLH